ncbi:MAG TPA: hypothetical protein VMS55_14525 [Myxococcota bacterium]|nr:hypothetical protein [Myxococcota bacterium]
MPNPTRPAASRSRRILLALGVGLAACAKPSPPEIMVPGAVTVRVGQIDPVALESAEKSAPSAIPARTEQLVDTLWDAGCLGSDVETPLPRVSSENPDIVCSLKGRTPQRILVLAHLDGNTREKGVPEHWSGVALLPFLYKALSVDPREYTFVFVAFGKSPPRTTRGYLERLGNSPDQSVRAIIDLQDVDPRAIWFSTPDEGLRRDFVAASLAVGRPLDSLRWFLPTADDAHTGVATLTIAAEPPGGIRSRKKGAALETPPQTEATSLPATARFTAVFLAYADETLRLRAEPPASVPASSDSDAR